MIDLQPSLTGALTRLRPLRPEDWTDLYAVASDPLIWADHPAKDRHKEDAFRTFFEGALASQSALAIFDLKTNKIIGSSRYHNYVADLSEIEIGWTFLARNYWGGAYNRDAKRQMLRHIFQYLETVVFWVADDNIRSKIAVERIGGVLRPGLVSKSWNGIDMPYRVFEVRRDAVTDL